MFQFYYAKAEEKQDPVYLRRLEEVFHVRALRPTMWEEHCLECAAPLCFGNCAHYEPRSDGRCRRFENGIAVRDEEKGCCGEAARLRFRPWGNLMTIQFPGMLGLEEYRALIEKNRRLGERLRTLNETALPQELRWTGIRAAEYLRRRGLRAASDTMPEPDAFVFHGYSFENRDFRLLMEVYQGEKPVFKTALPLSPGENLIVLKKAELSPECWRAGNLLKLYPENDLEAEIELLWCDFVQGEAVEAAQPAEKVKCLVWDLDNTFWDGILMETEDPETLSLRPGVSELIRALDERGILHSIASKNDYDAAWPVIERLGLAEYFLYPQIHWGAKSASIRQIAESLNIGVDALALIDDSAFERNQVSIALPCVRCYAETEMEHILSLPEFQTVVTDESRSRRAMYRAEEKRNVLRSENDDTLAFLRRCHLRMRIFTPETEAERLRCFELVNRTNQLNMSGRKYTAESFEELISLTDRRSFAFSCEDDFGTYGIVAPTPAPL